ncbi:MAG: flavodoxin [Kiritimatiellales bacterium]
MKTVIVYGSTTGSTETVAQDLAGAFPGSMVISAGQVSDADVKDAEFLIFGASTWGCGDLQDDMDAFLGQFSGWNVSAKTGAVFGLGDQFTYTDTYVDGMADMADALKNKGIKVVGAWPAAGYGHSASRAVNGDSFVGLALDQDNESDQTAERLSVWVKQIKAEL